MSEKKLVLIVEDEPDVSSFLTILLEDNGFTTDIAGNGREGMEQAAKLHPDLITLDISMPEESGLKMYKLLKENDDLKDIPVAVVTGITPEFKRFIEQHRKLPAPEAYFEKPIDKAEFIDTAKELTGQKS
ncbi:MAG TPA: response regulator [Bacteroidetes bacterium]|nr:polar-differentiation response regulator DivK [bacterium BMS3Bbin04]HDO65221.1 response regulator [Bacteroidota bacterium]HEX04346.1 response regulator [Bacteroidota bacterium]